MRGSTTAVFSVFSFLGRREETTSCGRWASLTVKVSPSRTSGTWFSQQPAHSIPSWADRAAPPAAASCCDRYVTQSSFLLTLCSLKFHSVSAQHVHVLSPPGVQQTPQVNVALSRSCSRIIELLQSKWDHNPPGFQIISSQLFFGVVIWELTRSTDTTGFSRKSQMQWKFCTFWSS